MSKAKEIAEERLAKGEITEAEFETLLSKFSHNNSTSTAPPAPAKPSPKESEPNSWNKLVETLNNLVQGFFGMVGIGVIVIFVAFLVKKDVPQVASVSSSSNYVKLKVLNDTKYSEDVVIVTTQNDVTVCQHIVAAKKDHTHTINYYCPLRDGKFQVRLKWASEERRLAAGATRIK